MKILIASGLLILGLILVVKGGDWFVDSSSWIAKALHIPDIIVGMTIVSIGTTLPEIMVSSVAAVKGSVDMAIGNAMGSVIFNTAIILAISFIFMNIRPKCYEIATQSLGLISAVGLLWLSAFLCDGIPYIISFFLLCIFVCIMIYNVKSIEPTEKKVETITVTKKYWLKHIVLFLIGGTMIFCGARLMVNNATIIARAVGVSEKIIGVTILAVGTSLPELVTTITAIRKKNVSIGIGNIIGANLIDITLILPLCSMLALKPIPISMSFVKLDFPVCFFVLCIGLIPTFIREKVEKWQGIVMLMSYGLFVYLMLA